MSYQVRFHFKKESRVGHAMCMAGTDIHTGNTLCKFFHVGSCVSTNLHYEVHLQNSYRRSKMGFLEKLHTGATLCNFFLWGYVQTHNEVNLHNSK